MRKLTLMIIGLITIFTSQAGGQNRYSYSRVQDYSTRSVFLVLGYCSGPHFPKFVDWANEYYAKTYDSPDKIKDFNGGVNFSAGFRSRFSHNFALEVDFAINSVSMKKAFNGGPPDNIGFWQMQKLDLNVAQFTGSPVIIFDFADRQLVVPFVGAGITLFSMRLDHSIDYNYLHTKVALASNFMIGIETRLGPRLWGDIRGDWTIGSVKMPVSPIVAQPESFTMSLNTAQIHLGIIYGLD